MTGIFFTNYNTPYLNLLDKFKLNKRPFNCALCFSWWLGVAYTVACYSNLTMIFIAPMAALLAIVVERLVKMLPVIL